MSYTSIAELPPEVKQQFPKPAQQKAYLETYNGAWEHWEAHVEKRGEARREQAASEAAEAAAKKV